MKRPLLILTLLALALTSTAGWSYYRRVSAGEGMTEQATKFLATLSDEQRKKANLQYDSPARSEWHFIPAPKFEREGLQIRDMDKAQRLAAHALLKTALSEAGYGKATKIMEMEGLLKELEKAKVGTPLRDSERYYFTVFGVPSAEGRWGLGVEGHHLSLNFVVDQGKVISSSPSTFAANPATVMSQVIPAIEKGTRVLKGEEQFAFDLLASLSVDQKKVAIIAETAPAEIRAAGESQPPTAAAEGIAAAKLNPEQSKLLHSLIGEYAANMPEEVAQARWAAIEKADFENVFFAWAGAHEPGIGHYYKVQGPTFLIEFVNTQPDAAGNPANHIHCIWRDMNGDFAIPLTK